MKYFKLILVCAAVAVGAELVIDHNKTKKEVKENANDETNKDAE